VNREIDFAYFEKLVSENLIFIENECKRAINVYYKSGKNIEYENEYLELFNIVVDKLKKDDFKVLRNFKQKANIKTYLRSIISFTFIDIIRRKKSKKLPQNGFVKRGFLLNNEKIEVVNGNSNPEKRVIENNMNEKLKLIFEEAFKKLDPIDLLIVKMKFSFQDREYSYMEIAKFLNLNVKNVYKRVYRALNVLKKTFKKNGVDYNDYL